MTHKDCDPFYQSKRQAYLDKLYELDGRNDKSHPMYGLYTGLYMNRKQKLLDQFAEALIKEDMNYVLYGLHRPIYGHNTSPVAHHPV